MWSILYSTDVPVPLLPETIAKCDSCHPSVYVIKPYFSFTLLPLLLLPLHLLLLFQFNNFNSVCISERRRRWWRRNRLHRNEKIKISVSFLLRLSNVSFLGSSFSVCVSESMCVMLFFLRLRLLFEMCKMRTEFEMSSVEKHNVWMLSTHIYAIVCSTIVRRFSIACR